MKDHSCPCVYVCRYAYVNTCCNNALDVCSYKSIYILYHLILYYITLYTYTFAWVYMGQYIYTYTRIYFYVYIYISYMYVLTYVYIHTHANVYIGIVICYVFLSGVRRLGIMQRSAAANWRPSWGSLFSRSSACLVVQQPGPCQAYVQGIMLNRTLAADQRMQFQSHPFDEPHHVLS